MSIQKLLLLFLIPVATIIGCKEELAKPSLNDGVAPGPVSNVKVDNFSGSAKLTYTLPSDPDLLYVEAVYSIRPNILRNTKASFYNNNLIVDGFSVSQEYEVKLYAVDKGENRSVPVTVKIFPGISPVSKAFASLQLSPAFGGINIKFLNADSANIVITTMIKNAEGRFVDIDKQYTSRKNGSYFIRGLPAVDTVFGVFISDRFDNLTDTLQIRLKPIFEEQVPFGTITVLQNIAGDVGKPRSPWNWTFMLDGDLVHNGNRFFVTENGTGIPQQFTMDFQNSYKLSRFKLWQRRENEYFTQGVREFELYGSMNPPNTAGVWDGTFIASYDNSFRPSGLPNGTGGSPWPADDVQYVLNGVDFEFPENMPPYRYIRLKTTKVWGLGTMVVIGELMFWGQKQ